MSTSEAIDHFLGIETGSLTPPMAEAVLAFSATEEVKQRVIELGDKANEGTISDDERNEYERYIELDELVTVLKSRARQFLASQS